MKTGGGMKYREISLEYEEGLDDEDLRAIALFNESFGENEIKLEHDSKRVVVFLREIDMEKLREVSRRLSSRTEKGIFRDVVRSIEGIGSYGIRGKKRNYADFAGERKVRDRKSKEAGRGRYFYARGHSFRREEAEFPREYEDRIIAGDSEEVLKNLPDGCVDLVFTSPPYNFGLEYAGGDDARRWEEYFGKLFRIFKECIRVTKFGGRIVVNVQPLFSDYIPSHHLISNFFMKERLIWKGEILWEKNNYNCKYTAWGSWKSPSNPYLKYTWEFLEVFCKGDLRKRGRKEDIDIREDEFKRWVVARWSIAPEKDMKLHGHPAMFPEELAERVLKLFSYRGDVVLDPFNGAGTTTLVARRLKRRYLGIDLSEEYCETARKRIEGLR